MHHTGLTAREVEASRAQHGPNVLTPPPRDPWWKLYLEKFEDPVIRILIIAAVVSFAVGVAQGHYAESIGIVLAVFLSTGLAFVNEYRANKEFDVLNQTSDDDLVTAVREGKPTRIAKRDVVVGDVVLLGQGVEIPADGRVLEATALEVNESSLTGESVPAIKNTGTEKHGAYAANELCRGSMVVDGHGVMVVERVGDATEIGRTARAALEETQEQSPLNRQLERLSKWIGVIGFAIAVTTFFALVARDALLGGLPLTGSQWLFAGLLLLGVAIALMPIWVPIVLDFFELTGREVEAPGWLEAGAKTWLGLGLLGVAATAGLAGLAHLAGALPGAPGTWLPAKVGLEFLEFFMIAVTIVVVAVPEGLAMSVTLSLAYSMRRMTATNCLVRKMEACETIGAATHICSDKTGTLTTNQMRVQDLYAHGALRAGDAHGLPADAHAALAEGIAANSTAHLGQADGGKRTVIGNPTEGALLLWLDADGHDYQALRDGFRTIRQWPFSTERKFMATLGESSRTGLAVLHVKGAPDYVMARCTHHHTPDGIAPLTDSDRVAIQAELLLACQRAMRTIALASREVDAAAAAADLDAAAQGLVWTGFVAIADPVRPDVRDAVATVQTAGIGVKIVTGDTPDTAREIGRQIGLWTPDDDAAPDRLMLGEQFAALEEDEAARVAPGLKILARARPADKLKLVRSIERAGGVVAVTGDGTNDAPALNYAQVGLAMGKEGTAYAKEASDIVILDDSFASIATAVQWGRSLYLNIQKFILFQLTINVAACGIALLGPFIGVSLPLTVTQMLWINLVMDTFAALALATEPPEPTVMGRPPRKADDFIVTGAMAKNIFATGGIFLVALIAMLRWPPLAAAFGAGDDPTSRLTVFFTFFVLLQFWNQLNARTLGSVKSAFSGLRENPWFLIILGAVLVGQVLIVTFGGSVFRVSPLGLATWAKLLGATSAVLWVGEAVRWWRRRALRTAAPAASTTAASAGPEALRAA